MQQKSARSMQMMIFSNPIAQDSFEKQRLLPSNYKFKLACAPYIKPFLDDLENNEVAEIIINKTSACGPTQCIGEFIKGGSIIKKFSIWERLNEIKNFTIERRLSKCIEKQD